MTDADGGLVLTIDIGTSSARAMLFDREARAVPGMEAREQYAMATTPDGGVEADAEGLLHEVEAILDTILLRAGPLAQRIDRVACCTFWHSVMGVDAAGAALTPVYTWADTRAEPQGRSLHETMDERKYHERTGAFFHPVYLPAKLLWLKSHPKAPEVKTWVSFGEFLYGRLFGRTEVSVSMASATGLLDIHSCGWDGETLRAVGVAPEELSPIGKSASLGLSAPYAERWPALNAVPWTLPVGDGACSNLGSGCVGRDRMAVMIGTSGAMRVTWKTDRVAIPWGLWCYRADEQRVVLGGALNDGGNLVEWCRKTLQLGEAEAVEAELAAMAPDSHGLTFLPFLGGERSPGWAAHARAAITGMSLDTKPLQILRAGMEAVALRFALIYQMLHEAVPGAREIVASGGALLKSPAWVQMLADAIGRPILSSAEQEASSRGAALLALEAVELHRGATGTTVPPDAARTELYRRALSRQQEHYRLLVERR